MITASAIPASREQTSPAPTPHLLDVLQQAAAEPGHPVETIWAYRGRTTRFSLFHGKRHPRDSPLPASTKARNTSLPAGSPVAAV